MGGVIMCRALSSPPMPATPSTLPLSEFHTRRRVEFADTDLAGICHFARYFVFLETAEHEFLEAIGANVLLNLDGHRIGWPRVAASCEYLAPARFGDWLDIHLSVEKRGRTSVTYAFAITRDGQPIARGRTTAVCCDLDAQGGPKPIEIPSVFLMGALGTE